MEVVSVERVRYCRSPVRRCHVHIRRSYTCRIDALSWWRRGGPIPVGCPERQRNRCIALTYRPGWKLVDSVDDVLVQRLLSGILANTGKAETALIYLEQRKIRAMPREEDVRHMCTVPRAVNIWCSACTIPGCVRPSMNAYHATR